MFPDQIECAASLRNGPFAGNLIIMENGRKRTAARYCMCLSGGGPCSVLRAPPSLESQRISAALGLFFWSVSLSDGERSNSGTTHRVLTQSIPDRHSGYLGGRNPLELIRPIMR